MSEADDDLVMGWDPAREDGEDQEEAPDLGTCCACGQAGTAAEGTRVRTILTLEQKAPMPGRGWGCVVCSLPPDGALAVLCNLCVAQEAELMWACRGYPGMDGRVGIETLTGVHRHDPRKHAQDEAFFSIFDSI